MWERFAAVFLEAAVEWVWRRVAKRRKKRHKKKSVPKPVDTDTTTGVE